MMRRIGEEKGRVAELGLVEGAIIRTVSRRGKTKNSSAEIVGPVLKGSR